MTDTTKLRDGIDEVMTLSRTHCDQCSGPDDGCWRCTPEKHQRPDGLLTLDEAKRVSVGRCARVSYLTHDGKRDIAEDVSLHDRLMNANPGHWTPFEHVARAEANPVLRSGNFIGWTQYRKLFEQEHIGGRLP